MKIVSYEKSKKSTNVTRVTSLKKMVEKWLKSQFVFSDRGYFDIFIDSTWKNMRMYSMQKKGLRDSQGTYLIFLGHASQWKVSKEV